MFDRLIDFLGIIMIYLLGAWSGILTMALTRAAEEDEEYDDTDRSDSNNDDKKEKG